MAAPSMANYSAPGLRPVRKPGEGSVSFPQVRDRAGEEASRGVREREKVLENIRCEEEVTEEFFGSALDD